MQCKVVELKHEHLTKLLTGAMSVELEKAYLSVGSVAYCLLADDEPVFAAGIVNLMWHRGEAWLLPTKFWLEHKGVCYRYVYKMLGMAAWVGKFKRVQATCVTSISTCLFERLGFEYEGTMKSFGPNGETCHMYARLFEQVS